jgi:hypothetical protein
LFLQVLLAVDDFIYTERFSVAGKLVVPSIVNESPIE